VGLTNQVDPGAFAEDFQNTFSTKKKSITPVYIVLMAVRTSSILQVKLLTKDKILKYTTEASSVNGYYMIPIYNKGDYILKVEPPPGWSFGENKLFPFFI
jgi:hypothetical protein